MRWPLPPPRAAGARERLDGPVPLADRAQSMADVARLNALFGGRRLTVRVVARLAAGLPRDRPLVVVDVGTGSADVPRAIVRWARRAGRPVRGRALDCDRDTLAVARRHLAGYPEITPVAADARALPVRAGGADVAVCALALHHLEPDEAAAALGEMAAAARAGVVNDLARSRHGTALVWLVTRVLATSPLSRHDGPLSVRRAYTPAEAGRLCARAGLRPRVRRHPLLLRYTATWDRGWTSEVPDAGSGTGA
jgi:ubiquinone/menaquinone biosynthesis C-methylase UbiE